MYQILIEQISLHTLFEDIYQTRLALLIEKKEVLLREVLYSCYLFKATRLNFSLSMHDFCYIP